MEGGNIPNIHGMPVNVCGNALIDVNTVRKWVSRVNSNSREKEEIAFSNRLRSVRPIAVVNENMSKQADTFIAIERIMQNSVKSGR